MKKNIIFTTILSFISTVFFAQSHSRFPQPDFQSGYVFPEQYFRTPNEAFWSYFDIFLLVALMSFVAWAVIKKQVRWPVIVTSIISIAYFGFFRYGCICSVGSLQNVVLSLVGGIHIPLFVVLLFILPIVFALFFGRVFCAGVCPLGALQEIVNIKNYQLSKAVTGVLSVFPWIYLGFAVLFAITHSGFIICRYDPFVGIFRLGGATPLIAFGVVLLIISIFTGRPFCRFICPYGAILSVFSRFSFYQVKITKKECINCDLCYNACPVDAIRPPYENKVKESRSEGVKRILRYVVFLPLMIAAGAITMLMLSDRLSRMNEDVRLYHAVVEHQANPQMRQSLKLEAFFGQEVKTVDDLFAVSEIIKADFRRFSRIIGGFLGLVIGLTLIGLSTKRTRKTYDIDDANCICCGRCFSYCPQNLS
ncbi:MAG: 4Fe-4S binding protein [Bacteroidales bacterium]|nr:4Fe-4S binding protein [Bacteroidales bacterium]